MPESQALESQALGKLIVKGFTAGGAIIGGMTGVAGVQGRIDAAAETARLAQVAASSQAQFMQLQNAADTWRLQLTQARSYRIAAEKEAMGAFSGAMAAGVAKMHAAASNLAMDQGTTTANMIAQARDRALGEGYAEAREVRRTARFNYTMSTIKQALDARARSNQMEAISLKARQAQDALSAVENDKMNNAFDVADNIFNVMGAGRGFGQSIAKLPLGKIFGGF